ncbi:inositol-trisphosphate 3-kinase B-like isoform X2 [Corticium candelabrum]|uniref:inositol-trisphosphate 3-kinase B-like isoform X2 n=1 Tax=Corticium candelabrum TaxID=121492 RepID=UPI002E262689|nr:inositol-trisphosphate 3-kinase B-like isoform X2 [Corticium candelabrum]
MEMGTRKMNGAEVVSNETACLNDSGHLSTRIEVLKEMVDEKSLTGHHPVPVNNQMLCVPGSHDGAFGSTESTKSRSSSVVSSVSMAEAMESDGESPPECSDVAFTFDAKTARVTRESAAPASGHTDCRQNPQSERITDPSDDDFRSQSGLSSCIDTDDDLMSDDIPCSASERKLVKRQGTWNLLRQVVFWSPFVQEYKRSYPWVQLAGHEGSFKPGNGGTILKRETPKERDCLTQLMKDVVKPYVPEYYGQVKENGEMYVRMQDLLASFEDPSVMDVKMGIRTYLEDELLKARTMPGYRTDLYEKMMKIDPGAPTGLERQKQAITKARYMQWRDTITTTSRYGYRIEAIKLPGQKPYIKEFRNMKNPTDVGRWFVKFSGLEKDTSISRWRASISI